MPDFTLDERLQNDCIQLGESDTSLLLLMNNALFPWFILVPKTHVTEFYQLDNRLQTGLLSEINLLSEFIKNHFQPDKLNIASIGNIVSQMHIHLIGRTRTDPCWPGVVWGSSHKLPYNENQLGIIKAQVEENLAEHFQV